MYQNRNHRTATSLDLQSLIRRSDFAFDERARYVESVCAVLIESRFGPDGVPYVSIDWSDCPECEPALYSDLLDDEPNVPFPSYTFSSLGRAAYQAAAAANRRAKQMALVDAGQAARNSPASLTPNQGRGSP
jgi:hypothetical protein